MNHEDTKSPRAAKTAPLCLCGGTDLWQIYGGPKGGNPVSMLDRVCNGLATPPNMTIFEFRVFVGMIYSRNYQKLNLKNDSPFFAGQVWYGCYNVRGKGNFED